MGRLTGASSVIEEDLARIIDASRDELGMLVGRRLLITGGTGFVGRYLVESILRWNSEGHGPPCVLGLPTREPALLEARYSKAVKDGQIELAAWTAPFLLEESWGPWDYLVHAASPVEPRSIAADPDRSLRDMIEVTGAVADLVKRWQIPRCLFMSSGAVYGTQPVDLAEVPESYLGAPDLTSISSAYAEGKRIAEMLLRVTGVDLRVLRIFSLIGPYQDPSGSYAVPNFVLQADRGGGIRLSGDGTAMRSYCYATDLSIIAFRMLTATDVTEPCNVGNRDSVVSAYDVASAVSEIFGGIPVERAPRGTGPNSRYVPSLMRMDDLWQPRVGLREGLLRYCWSLYERGLISRRPTIGLHGVARQ